MFCNFQLRNSRGTRSIVCLCIFVLTFPVSFVRFLKKVWIQKSAVFAYSLEESQCLRFFGFRLFQKSDKNLNLSADCAGLAVGVVALIARVYHNRSNTKWFEPKWLRFFCSTPSQDALGLRRRTGWAARESQLYRKILLSFRKSCKFHHTHV